MRKFREIIPNLILLASVLIVSLFIFEIISDQYIKENKIAEKLDNLYKSLVNADNLNIGCFDKDLGWGFKPGSGGRRRNSDFNIRYSINSQGNRDKEAEEVKPATTFRIIALGESMVFGEGINYGRRFSEVIEDSLVNVDVINMGIWGFGIDQSLLQLKRDGFKFQPDAVILFAINDFFDRCKYISRAGNLKPRFVVNPAKDGIILQDLEFIKQKLKLGPSYRTLAAENKIKSKKNAYPQGSNLIFLFDYARKIAQINKLDKESDKKLWSRILGDLAADRQYTGTCSKEDFRKLIYLILQDYSVVCKKYGVDFILVHIDVGDELSLQDLCRQLNIAYLDLSPVLSCASEKKPLIFAIDPHYNNYTHKIIGEYVSDYLKKRYGLKKAGGYSYKYLGKF